MILICIVFFTKVTLAVFNDSEEFTYFWLHAVDFQQKGLLYRFQTRFLVLKIHYAYGADLWFQ